MARRSRRASLGDAGLRLTDRDNGTSFPLRGAMSSTEYLLVALTILVPLVIAVVVTLWTLEQARLRSKKNRKRAARPAAEPPPPPGE
jgi:uncharacterized metal-binding protein